MHPVLNRNLYFVKEHTGLMTANNYDVLDPQSKELVLQCREEQLGALTKVFRFCTDYKRMTPFNVQIRTPMGEPVVSVRRGVSILASNVDVLDEHNQRVGGFKQKWFSLGGSFHVLGAGGEPLCELNGKWTGWDFRFVQNGNELARVSKKWSGLGKEMFTSADNYILEITNQVPANDPLRMLIVGAVMCIDLVLKE